MSKKYLDLPFGVYSSLKIAEISKNSGIDAKILSAVNSGKVAVLDVDKEARRAMLVKCEPDSVYRTGAYGVYYLCKRSGV